MRKLAILNQTLTFFKKVCEILVKICIKLTDGQIYSVIPVCQYFTFSNPLC